MEKFAEGNRQQAARALTEAEEDLLFDNGLLGKYNPEVLQRTVWWAIALHFRGGSRIFCTLVKIFVAIQQGGITYFFSGGGWCYL